jgi:hypothetical protein
MWRQLLASTDQVGKAFLVVAGMLLATSVTLFATGIVQAATGRASGTLPFWLGTMGCAALAGALVYAASRRGATPGR